MAKKIGRLINAVLSVFGVEMHTIGKKFDRKNEITIDEINNLDDQSRSLIGESAWLKKIDIKSVLDIGANEGQFAEKFSHILPEATFYCFEPLSDVFKQLQIKFNGKRNFYFFNFALGLENRKENIYRNEYSPSSSLLLMGETHKEAFDFAKKETVEQIEIKRLDDVMRDVAIEKPYLVKIDVQGYELSVIEGGLNIIENAEIIILETSFVKLYDQGPLFDDVYKKMYDMDFVYAGSFEQLKHPNDGRILQQDSIFIKHKNHDS